MKLRKPLAILAFAIPLVGIVSIANAQTAAKDQTRNQTQDRIYGSQLMTQQERNEYRDRMRAAKTEQERERIRAEHHQRMTERARERGITLPDDPPAKGSGRGMGPAGGMGPGGGMGGGSAGGGGGGGGGGR
ncbi:MAG: hypothetical protein OEV67_14425 [Betaproteobacteria bacterium]|jgi:hypothetical protein|nr:hypothetical protein [Betaproteobacteria bacterium]MDH4294072.1 hypothetical protein [Betaproteobacteria bacterium]